MDPQQQQQLEQMRAAYAKRDFPRARMLGEQVLSRSRKNAEALFIMGNVMQSERRFEDSIRYLERSLKLQPESVGVLMTLANVLRLDGKLDPALRRIDKAFLDLPWDDRCLRFHESSRSVTTLSREQVRRPIYRTSMGRAERFGDRLAPLRAALAAP